MILMMIMMTNDHEENDDQWIWPNKWQYEKPIIIIWW